MWTLIVTCNLNLHFDAVFQVLLFLSSSQWKTMECGSGMINDSLVHKGQRLPRRLVSSRCSFEKETAQTKQAFPSTFEGKKGSGITNQSCWELRLIV